MATTSGEEAQRLEDAGAKRRVLLDLLEFLVGERGPACEAPRRARQSCRCRAAGRPTGATSISVVGQGQLRPIATDSSRDAFGVAGRVAVARVERRRQRADDAEIGGLGLVFGGLSDCVRSVSNVSVSASISRVAAGRRQGVSKSRAAAIRRSVVGSCVNRAGQRPRQPRAAERRQQRASRGRPAAATRPPPPWSFEPRR